MDDKPWRIQPIVLKGNTSYTFSAWVKFQPDGPEASVNCSIIPKIYNSKIQVKEKSGWTHYTTVFTTPDTASVIVSPQPARLHGPGQLWIDDVILTEQAEPEKNILDNGDFEISRGTQPRGCRQPQMEGNTWLNYSPIREFLKGPEKYQIQ